MVLHGVTGCYIVSHGVTGCCMVLRGVQGVSVIGFYTVLEGVTRCHR